MSNMTSHPVLHPSRLASARRLLPALRLLLLALAGATAGCSQTYTPLPVSGKVLLDGKPLTGGMVTYSPDESKGNTLKLGAVGKIQPNGSYTLEANGKPGVPEGWYKVTVQTKIPGLPAVERDVATAYQSVEKTPLNIEVKADKTKYDLLLTP